MTPTRCIRVPEVAARLGVSRRTAYTLIEQNRLPAVRLGRAITVTEAALEQFIADGGVPHR